MRAKEFITEESIECMDIKTPTVYNRIVKFIDGCKKNKIVKGVWQSFIKSNLIKRGQLINCPNSKLSDSEKHLLLQTINEIDMIIAHMPEPILGVYLKNTNIELTKDLIKQLTIILSLYPKLTGHPPDSKFTWWGKKIEK